MDRLAQKRGGDEDPYTSESEVDSESEEEEEGEEDEEVEEEEEEEPPAASSSCSASSAGPTLAAEGVSGESEYEMLRRMRIKQNELFLAQLGFSDEPTLQLSRRKRPRQKPSKGPQQPPRRSSRNEGKAVIYTAHGVANQSREEVCAHFLPYTLRR